MIISLSEEKNEKNNEKFKISSIKCKTVFIKEDFKTCLTKMQYQDYFLSL